MSLQTMRPASLCLVPAPASHLRGAAPGSPELWLQRFADPSEPTKPLRNEHARLLERHLAPRRRPFASLELPEWAQMTDAELDALEDDGSDWDDDECACVQEVGPPFCLNPLNVSAHNIGDASYPWVWVHCGIQSQMPPTCLGPGFTTMHGSIGFSTLQQMAAILGIQQGTVSQNDFHCMAMQAPLGNDTLPAAALSNYWGDSPWQSPTCAGKGHSLVSECGSGVSTVCPSPEKHNQLPYSKLRTSSFESLSDGEEARLRQEDFWALVLEDEATPGAGCCPARDNDALAHLRWADGIGEDEMFL